MSEWQDISSAPRDGTWLLLKGGETDEEISGQHYNEADKKRPCIGKWGKQWDDDIDGQWLVGFWDGDWRNTYKNPTHWRLP